jgi:hypothetical protein
LDVGQTTTEEQLLRNVVQDTELALALCHQGLNKQETSGKLTFHTKTKPCKVSFILSRILRQHRNQEEQVTELLQWTTDIQTGIGR